MIGKAGAPHGVAGEIRVQPMTDFPERFDGLRTVYLGDERMSVSRTRWQGRRLLVTFDGVSSREAASALTGRLLSVDRKDAVPLEAGEYYTFDIVGLRVVDPRGEELGEVTEVLRTGANDVYVVRGEAGEVLIPALKSVVTDISLDEGTMTVDLPELEEA